MSAPPTSRVFHALICRSIVDTREEVKALSNASALDSIKLVSSSGPDCPQQYNTQVCPPWWLLLSQETSNHSPSFLLED